MTKPAEGAHSCLHRSVHHKWRSVLILAVGFDRLLIDMTTAGHHLSASPRICRGDLVKASPQLSLRNSTVQNENIISESVAIMHSETGGDLDPTE